MINKFKGFETQYIDNMFRVDKIDKLNDLSRRAKYDKAYMDELKLVAFTLNKEIDQDEKHNFNIIFDFIKSKNDEYFSILNDGFHCSTPVKSDVFGPDWNVTLSWRSSYYNINKKMGYWGCHLFRQNTEYKGLYVKTGNTYKRYTKRKDILNFYFDKGLGTTTTQLPLPAREFNNDTAIDVKTNLEMIRRFVTKSIILTNLKLIRRFVKSYHWQGKEEIVKELKKYSHIR